MAGNNIKNKTLMRKNSGNTKSSSVSTEKAAQEAVDKVVQYLEDRQASIKDITVFSHEITRQITARVIAIILDMMSKDEQTQWNKFVETGANEAQQLLIMDTFLQKKSGKTFAQLQSEITIKICDSTIEQLDHIKDLDKSISKLSPEEVQKATRLLQSGDLKGAKSIISKAE